MGTALKKHKQRRGVHADRKITRGTKNHLYIKNTDGKKKAPGGEDIGEVIYPRKKKKEYTQKKKKKQKSSFGMARGSSPFTKVSYLFTLNQKTTKKKKKQKPTQNHPHQRTHKKKPSPSLPPSPSSESHLITGRAGQEA